MTTTVATHVAIESIYRLIYSVIIWSAIARASNERDNRINEIPNVSIGRKLQPANAASMLGNTGLSNRVSSSKRIPEVPNSRARSFRPESDELCDDSRGDLFQVLARGNGKTGTSDDRETTRRRRNKRLPKRLPPRRPRISYGNERSRVVIQ